MKKATDYNLSDDIPSSKADIRRLIKKTRSQLPEAYADKASQIIFDRIGHMPEFAKLKHIFCYVSYNSEVDTTGFIRTMLGTAGVHIYVPRVEGSHIMNFYEIHDIEKDLVSGAYGILEPSSGCPAAPQSADRDAVMIMPGLAFDCSCNRIGYGGGFYDAYLAGHPSVFKIAAAFDCQIIDVCPDVEITDIKPDIIVTEKRVIERRR